MEPHYFYHPVAISCHDRRSAPPGLLAASSFAELFVFLGLILGTIKVLGCFDANNTHVGAER